METKVDWRASPAPLLIALGTWLLFAIFRLLYGLIVTDASIMTLQRLSMIGHGIGFAAMFLLLVGVLELLGRPAAPRGHLKVAAAMIGVNIALDVVSVFVQFTNEPWNNQTLWELIEYTNIGAWLVFVVAFALALPASQRAFGYIAIAVTIVTWLPLPIARKLWAALGVNGLSLGTVHFLLRIARFAVIGWLVIKVASPTGTTVPRPQQAAEGLRLAAKGLWLRVIAALVVVMFTLMMVGGRSGGSSSLAFFKLLMMCQAVVAVIALLMTGLGALKAARAGIGDFAPYMLAIAGGASLWAAGVSFEQVPAVYKMFYAESGMFSRREMREMMELLSVALPVVVIVGVGMLATALSGYAARRGNEDLHSEAQGKGIGYVVLMLVAIALQTWMLPKSRSLGAFAMLSLLSAGASLWATVMIAKLLGRGADILETEPGLPMASVVSDAPPPPLA